MKFKNIIISTLALLFSIENVKAADPRELYITGLLNSNHVESFKFPTTLPTAGRVAIFDGSSIIGNSAVTTTTLSYLDISSSLTSLLSGKQATLTPGTVSTSTTGVTIGSGSNSTVGPNVTVNVQTATDSIPGLISAADHAVFNSKVPATRTISTTAPLQGGGDLSANRTLTCDVASGSQPGCLSTASFNSFAGKLSNSLANGKIFMGTSSNTATASAVGGDLTAVFNAVAPEARFTVTKVLGVAPSTADVPNSVVLRDGSGSFTTESVILQGEATLWNTKMISDPSGNSDVDTQNRILWNSTGLGIFNWQSGVFNSSTYAAQSADVNLGILYNPSDTNPSIDWFTRVMKRSTGLFSIDYENSALVTASNENYILNWANDESLNLNGAFNFGLQGTPSAFLSGFTIYTPATKMLSFYTGSVSANNDFSNLSRDRTYTWPDNDGTVTVGGPYVPSSGGNISGGVSIDPSADVVPLTLNHGSGFTSDLYKYSFAGNVLGGMRSDARTYWGASAGSASVSNLFVSRSITDSVVVAKAAGSQSGSLFSAQNSSASEMSAIAADGKFLIPDGTVSLPGLAFLNNSNTGIYRIGTSQLGIATAGIRAVDFDLNQNASFNGEVILKAGNTNNSSINVPSGASRTSPTEGDVWNDSTQKTFIRYNDGIKQADVGTIFTQTATGTVANTVSETSIDSTGIGTKTLPANFFVAGKTLRITGSGFFSTTGAPKIRIKIKLGSTVILDTTAVNSGLGSSSLFTINGTITCRTTGASGTVFAQGVHGEYGTSTVFHPMVNAATTTVDTTASQAITTTATWDTASASDTISETNLSIEALN